MMIEQCWAQLNAESLADYGLCNCRGQCQRKAELVDALLAIWESHGIAVAAAAGRLATRSVPNFALM
jgi:hypothetical protein